MAGLEVLSPIHPLGVALWVRKGDDSVGTQTGVTKPNEKHFAIYLHPTNAAWLWLTPFGQVGTPERLSAPCLRDRQCAKSAPRAPGAE